MKIGFAFFILKMIISGIQKLSMLDYPEKLACTLFSPGCNFRCPFCHNAVLVCSPKETDRISVDEILSFLSRREKVLDGVVLSGGEPLLQEDIEEFLERLREFDLLIKLDTNGSFPEKLKGIIKRGLVDYVAMDLKNCKEKYPITVGKEVDLSKIEDSVDLLKEGVIEYEFRTTLVKELHEQRDLLKIRDWIAGAEAYYLQKFVDSGGLISKGLHAFTDEEMRGFRELLSGDFVKLGLRGVE